MYLHQPWVCRTHSYCFVTLYRVCGQSDEGLMSSISLLLHKSIVNTGPTFIIQRLTFIIRNFILTSSFNSPRGLQILLISCPRLQISNSVVIKESAGPQHAPVLFLASCFLSLNYPIGQNTSLSNSP